MNTHAENIAALVGGATKDVLMGTFDSAKAVPGSHLRAMSNLANLGLIDAQGNPTALGNDVKAILAT